MIVLVTMFDHFKYLYKYSHFKYFFNNKISVEVIEWPALDHISVADRALSDNEVVITCNSHGHTTL